MTELVVVVATGTEVGKTHVSESVLRSLRLSGRVCIGLKPVESGVDGSSRTDWERLGQGAGRSVAPMLSFEEPVSPHLAARDAGVEIKVREVLDWVQRSREDVTLVETAGGLLSPLSQQATNLDLCSALRPRRVLLVARNRLGALHDVGVCMMALQQSGWARGDVVVAFNDVDAPEGRAMATNAEELVRLGVVECMVAFPHAPPTAEPTQKAGRAVVEALGLAATHEA